MSPNTPNSPADSPADSAARRRKMIWHLSEACRLARLEGTPNFLRTPGLVQQLVLSHALGHVPRLSWRDGRGDAHAVNDPKRHFEYFTALEGRRFQTGTAGEGGRCSRDKLRQRILDAASIYLAVFDFHEPLKLLRVYEVAPATLWEEAARQIDKSAKGRANVTASERWAATHGRRILPDAGDDARDQAS